LNGDIFVNIAFAVDIFTGAKENKRKRIRAEGKQRKNTLKIF
jgi:hypothetical protein